MTRKQPVVVGTDAKGELVWGFIPMPRWQAMMFPVRYVGDFLGFWYRKSMESKIEKLAEDIAPSEPNMDLSKRFDNGKKSNRPTWGD